VNGRPTVTVLIAGTGTDVGKTWVSARLLEAWTMTGLSVAARKPAQSFTPGEGPTDAHVLGAASGEDAEVVCPPTHWYGVALAPPMAAAALGQPVPTVADLVGAISWPDVTDMGLVETAGGVRSPQAGDGDVIDMVRAIAPDHVVLVADAGLGTINAVRLSLEALGAAPTPLVILNRYDASCDLHQRNLAWLRQIDGIDVVEASPDGLATTAHRLASTVPAGP
jgi:dethiobiotin synthetase